MFNHRVTEGWLISTDIHDTSVGGHFKPKASVPACQEVSMTVVRPCANSKVHVGRTRHAAQAF